MARSHHFREILSVDQVTVLGFPVMAWQQKIRTWFQDVTDEWKIMVIYGDYLEHFRTIATITGD